MCQVGQEIFPTIPVILLPMIIHIDMDSFYASVEVREHPELVMQPVAVGGSATGRGVVAAANYEARKFGVRSAMPMATALRRCPQLVCLPVNMPLYVEVSKQIHEIFNRYTSEIEPLSLDEAFLDVRASKKLFGSAAGIARQITCAGSGLTFHNQSKLLLESAYYVNCKARTHFNHFINLIII